MKNIFTLLVALLLSCVNITTSEPLFVESNIINRYHRDSETIYEYHYGYDVFESEFKFHYGPHEIAEVNEVSFLFFDDLLTYDNKLLYSKSKVSIKYKKIYHDGVFHHNRIISVK